MTPLRFSFPRLRGSLATLLLGAALPLASVPLTALAHGDFKAPHGGAVAEAPSGHHIELVREDGRLAAYLTDHDGKPVNAQGAQAEVTLLSGGAKSTAHLAPAGGNKLIGATTAATAAAGDKAVLRLTLPGKAAEQVRLTLK